MTHGINELAKSKDTYKNAEGKKTQKRFDYLLANGPLVFYSCNIGGEWACTFLSTNIIHQLGYEPQEFCENPGFRAAHIHPDDRQRVFDGLSNLLENGHHVHEYRFLNKEGTYRWLHDELRLVYDSDGKPVDCSGFWIDITDRKQAEEALRASEERYRLLFENMLDGFAYCRMLFENDRPQDFIYLDVNSAFEELTGLKNVIGRKVTEVIPGVKESYPELFEIYGRVALTGQPERFEIYLKPLAAWLSISVYSTEKEYFTAVFDNVTQRKKAEEELRNALKRVEDEKARSEAIIAAIGDGISIQDRDFKILYQNQVLINLTGNHVGEYCYTAYEGMERTCEGCPVAMSFKDGKIHTVVRSVLTDKGMKYLENTASALRDSEGKIIAGIEVVRDITERKRAEERMSRQLQKLSALRAIDLSISSSLDLRVILKIFIEHVVTQLGVDAANVLLLNQHSMILEYAASQGFRTNVLKHSHLHIGEGYAGIAALENRIVSVPDLTREDTGFKRLGLLEGEDFITYYGVPLMAKGHVKGVLEIFHRSPLEPDEEWFEFLDALALQAAIAIDNNSLFYELERSNMGLILAYDSTIEGWSRALDYRDKETEGHSQRVTEMTINIARALGMNEEELVHVKRGALLHDIGKMGIPDSILLKPGPLTEEEWKIMRLHPVYSHELLQPIAYLRTAIDIPYCHHEKWDGSGYPRGLKGEQIPLSARIFAVVDVWDALCSDRPYRPAWSREKAKEYIASLSGIQFDPKVIDVFSRMLL
jgi:PAS domain S-box-containing protein/putative nucleotidyltransferase with HDIG domain